MEGDLMDTLNTMNPPGMSSEAMNLISKRSKLPRSSTMTDRLLDEGELSPAHAESGMAASCKNRLGCNVGGVFIKAMIFAFCAMMIGQLIDQIVTYGAKRLERKNKVLKPVILNLLVILQLVIIFTVLSFIYIWLTEHAREFQGTLPGLVFSGLFFGVQSGMFSRAQRGFFTIK